LITSAHETQYHQLDTAETQKFPMWLDPRWRHGLIRLTSPRTYIFFCGLAVTAAIIVKCQPLGKLIASIGPGLDFFHGRYMQDLQITGLLRRLWRSSMRRCCASRRGTPIVCLECRQQIDLPRDNSEIFASTVAFVRSELARRIVLNVEPADS
jgi:hypothetical protein